MGRIEQKRALISVFHKAGIADFAERLVALGFDLYSSGGTAKHLREQGLAVIDVADIIGMPPILDHRVVTLHPKIHGGILALDKPEHQAEMILHGIVRFHVVCVDLYPVIEAIEKPDATVESVMNLTDIGGPTMIRGAAKNHERVIVICDPEDRDFVLAQLEETGDVDFGMRKHLAQKVFELMSRYDDAINRFMCQQTGFETATLFLTRGVQVAYAENKCQNPAHLFRHGDDDLLAMPNFEVTAGEPSYTAYADASGIVDILCLIAESFRRSVGRVPHIVVAGKHGNPCGCAIDWENPHVAIIKALMGDPVAVMGGEVVTNFPVYYEEAEALFAPDSKSNIGRNRWGLDVILAPSFEKIAAELLCQKEKRRLLANKQLEHPLLPKDPWIWRQVRGGFLRQRTSSFVFDPAGATWTGQDFSGVDLDSLILAWACCWRASSNTVVLAKGRMLIGLGCGQQDRIACVRLCLDRAIRAGHNPKGSVFASDGFFPYAEADVEVDVAALRPRLEKLARTIDISQEIALHGLSELRDLITRMDRREGPQLLVDAGCIGGVVPADGKNLPMVQEFFRQHGLSVAFVAPENRGFSKH